jgi:hypothetical protein
MGEENPFLQRLGQHLIDAPAPSLALLAAVGAGARDWHDPPGTKSALSMARAWLHVVLRSPFAPAQGVPLLALPKEAGAWDTIRADYETGGYRFHVAQTRHLLSIRLVGAATGVEAGPRAALLLAETCARRMLSSEEKISLALMGRFREGFQGERALPPEGPVSAEWPHWLDLMSWWVSGGDVGFITLKADGGPAREVPSVEDEDNRDWFES